MLRVTPIYGSSLAAPFTDGDGGDPKEWLSSPAPSCTLVEYAGMRLLLNAGWDESLPPPGSARCAAPSGGAQHGGEAEPNPSLASVGVAPAPILPQELPDADAILVCDSTLSSLGGLPAFFAAGKRSKRGRVPRSLDRRGGDDGGRNGGSMPAAEGSGKRRRNPPFYGTYPTVKMGQMTLYDHHASMSLDGMNPGYSLEDVDAVFSTDSFRTLKYSQAIYLPLDKNDEEECTDDGVCTTATASGKASSENSGNVGKNRKSPALLAITPQRSGRVVGGCYWVLKRLSDETEVVLAPTYHHAKEKHLGGSTLHTFGVNADALLTAPGGARGLLGSLYQQPPRGKTKPILSPPLVNRCEAEVVECIMAALRRDGNVLLPVDASGRVLELLLVLNRHWERQRLGAAYNLCWVGPMAMNTIEFARSQLEWMAEPLGAQFDSQRGHPYALKSVQICSSTAELEAVIEASNGNPTAVLASGASLDHGPARDLLLKWGENPDNLVLITDSTRCVPRGNIWFARHAAGGRRGNANVVGGAIMPELPNAPLGGITAKERITSGGGVIPTAVEEGEGEEDANLVGAALLTSDISAYTTASQLLYQWCAAKSAGEEMADVVEVDVYATHRAKLAGAELKAFLAEEEAERRERKAEAEKKAMMQEIELARGRLRLGEDEAASGPIGSSGKTGGASVSGVGPKSTTAAKVAGTSNRIDGVRPKKKSRFDSNLFIKFSKPVHMMFEVREEAVGIGQPDSVAKYGIGESIGRSGEILEDDYGIAVKSDKFVDIVTGVDPSKFAGGSGRIGEEVLRRGLGFGSDGRPVLASSGGLPARRSGEASESIVKDGAEDDAANNEKALEAADLSGGKGIIKGRNGRPPTKVSQVPRRFEVLAEVVYVPIEGRVDARAARQSVRALQPRHLVIIGGPKSHSLSLADSMRTLGPTNSGVGVSSFLPQDGETVQLTVGHAAYSVRLIDTPYLTKKEKEEAELSGKEIDPVEPFEAKIGDCTVSLLDCVATGKKWSVDSSIVLAPRAPQSNLKQPSLMLSTREILLTDLRTEVVALGMKAEYGAQSGYSQLVVNGKIVVRKDNNTGKIHVEGPLCQDFYRVRSVVCGQFVPLT